MANPKVIAFFLPQFHTIPENDSWWGEGFTEWTNVQKAKPGFPGHRQPRVPLDGKYYNLLDPEVQNWQAKLAVDHGIYGFCYYHYWFNGRQLLEKPLEGVVSRGTPELPFCVAWANEPWTRAWDGSDREVIMPQTYGGPSDWERHYRCLERLFLDPRYIRVGGLPMILIYRSNSIDDCDEMIGLWRKLALESGLAGLHVVSMITIFGKDSRVQLFDAYVEFEPNHTQAILPRHIKIYERLINLSSRLSWRLFGTSFCAPQSRSYKMLWDEIAKRKLPSKHYPGAFVDWDNSPRKKLDISLVLRGVSVDAFHRGFSRLYKKAINAKSAFIFINAWNEWAEGTYLEPDDENGTAHLSAIKSVLFENGHDFDTIRSEESPNQAPA